MISHAIAARFNNCQFQTADSELHESAYNGDVKSLKKLISQDDFKSQLNKRNHLGCTPLRLAATGGHVEAARVLLLAGASVDISDVKGQTPLFVAVKNNHHNCARLLLQHGANAEGSDENVASPLYTAAMNGFISSVKVLLEFGARIIVNENQRVIRPFSMDPLQIAVAYHQFDCVKLLLRVAYCSQIDQRETTPLYHIAIKQKCQLSFLHLLHEFGMSVYKVDNQGRFPWQLDFSGYSEEVKEKMLQYLQYMRDQPRSLKSICRLTIIQNLSRKNKLADLDSLCIPQSLLSYLMFDDVRSSV